MKATKFVALFTIFISSAIAINAPAVVQMEALEKRELGPRQGTPPNSPALFEEEDEEDEELRKQ
ncbi:uncharacterized protein FPRO_15838 [Fusarium proliferatum ET1]|uniref:Uncharacterized protein n=1 Tax=Fusarium proliferatum (strain ET1) TaxID=1227346 RepID=A0A1L7WA40_FUSPR|nr:uncharacterized protein FPRO_15838 [Fusarium proliferatum ET1]CZR49478.1 uncharacterized protein FPRO_15838 [Fusarium proliferatum ET1]